MEGQMAQFLQALKESEERTATRQQESLERSLFGFKEELKQEIHDFVSTLCVDPIDEAVPHITSSPSIIVQGGVKVATSYITIAPITCSTECPSRDGTTSASVATPATTPTSPATTVNIFPELTAPVVSNEALDADAISAAAPTPTTNSTDGLDHGTSGYDPVGVSLVLWDTNTSFTTPPEDSPTPPQELTLVLEPGALVRTKCSTVNPGHHYNTMDDIKATTVSLLPTRAVRVFADGKFVYVVFMLWPPGREVAVWILLKGQMFRPRPWPFFSCNRVGTQLIQGMDLFKHGRRKHGQEFLSVWVLQPPWLPLVQDILDTHVKGNTKWLEDRAHSRQLERIILVKLKPPWPHPQVMCMRLSLGIAEWRPEIDAKVSDLDRTVADLRKQMDRLAKRVGADALGASPGLATPAASPLFGSASYDANSGPSGHRSATEERGMNVGGPASPALPPAKGILKELDVQGHGIPVTVANTTFMGMSALHAAGSHGSLPVYEYLVEEVKMDIHKPDTAQGYTPVEYAVQNGHLHAVRYLLDRGADLHQQRSSITRLHSAAVHGQSEIVKFLLSKGADVDATSDIGTPLALASLKGHASILKILLQHNADPNKGTALFVPLALALHKSFVSCVKLLIQGGANVSGDNPLAKAAEKGLTEAIKCLLEAGANPNVVDRFGRLPIELAAEYGTREDVEILFPFTSPISTVGNWSVDGIIKHVEMEKQLEDGSFVKKKMSDIKQQADEAFKQQDYLNASVFYTQALKMDNFNAKLLSNRSLCLLRMGDGRRAYEDAAECTKLRPKWAKVHYREGAALMFMKDYDAAYSSHSWRKKSSFGSPSLAHHFMQFFTGRYGVLDRRRTCSFSRREEHHVGPRQKFCGVGLGSSRISRREDCQRPCRGCWWAGTWAVGDGPGPARKMEEASYYK